MDSLLQDLTDAQRQAVTHIDGPLLILAGPGSGKTRVVTHRVAYLLRQGIAPQSILALTFTNKAAEEMKSRLERLAPGQAVWMGTFHRFCARLLRRHARLVGLGENFSIYDSDDALRLLKRTIRELSIEAMAASPEAVYSAISWAKNNLVLPDTYKARPGHAVGGLVEQVYPVYQQRLAAANAVDFDDLLLHVATLLRENAELRRELDHRYRYILVDEYQDTNLAQYAIARSLSIDEPNLAVTGDPDQSIYGWRGANLRNILDFEHDYPKVRIVRLERNYRSTKRILAVADALIRRNVRRKQKELFTDNAAGERVRLVTYSSNKEEAEDIARRIGEAIDAGKRRPRDFAIFYRINALSRSLEVALRHRGIPYQIVRGLEFFQRQEIKDVMAYLHLLNNPQSEIAFGRVINTPARGIGKAAVDRLAAAARLGRHSLFEAARNAERIEGFPRRTLPKVRQFVEMIDRLSAACSGSIEEVLGLVLNESGYEAMLRGSPDPQDQERLANIQELLTVARDFDERHGNDAPLEQFLEETSLVNDVDAWEDELDRVSLMSLHASKGLEFPVVFLIAVEEGLLPHERAREQPDQLEEERRLMFVGITRAEQELQLSHARTRDFRGQRRMTVASTFLMELPREEMERLEWCDVAEYDDLDVDDGQWSMAEAPRPAMAPVEAKTLALTTAAEMIGGGSLPPVPPDSFQQGMVVRHPSYGLGKIAALSGSGLSRRATVDFSPPTGRVKFVLYKSPLRPVRVPPGESAGGTDQGEI